MSVKVYLRHSDEELRMLDELIATNNVTGFESRAEWYRLQLYREYNRAKGLPAPKAWQWQSAARNGRPAGRPRTAAKREATCCGG